MHPFLPVLTLMLWTFCIGIFTGINRRKAAMNRRVNLKDVALGSDAWPDDVKKWGNNFNNLFQVPLVFYGIMIMAFSLHYHPTWFMIVAWCFVLTRFAHSIIHVTTNYVPHRFMVFILGNVLNFILAITLFFKVL